MLGRRVHVPDQRRPCRIGAPSTGQRLRRRDLRIALVGLTTISVLTGMLPVLGLVKTARAATPVADAFVKRDGLTLSLNGQPYRFTGMNIYQANSSPVPGGSGNCGQPMSSGSALDDALTAIGPGQTVFRAWFFQNLATIGGVRDWTAFNHTLSVARARGARVIATLSNQWADCDSAVGSKAPAWYGSLDASNNLIPGDYANVVDPGGTKTYQDWVQEIANHYADDPTIVAWELMNEPEIKDAGGSCTVGGQYILKQWAANVSHLIKAFDGRHLVSLGTIGDNQCGQEGDSYGKVQDVPGIDLCSYHDYQPTEPMPSGHNGYGLQARLNACAALQKPVFVGEVGIDPSKVGGTLDARATALEAKLQQQFEAGVAGVLAWNWNSPGSSLTSFEIGPGDPVLPVLRKHGGGCSPGDPVETLSAAPASVQRNALVDDCRFRIFEEHHDYHIPADLTVDAYRSGRFDGRQTTTSSKYLAGTVLSSYFIHADRPGNPGAEAPFYGSITFDADIAGVIFKDSSLAVSEQPGGPMLGALNTLYPGTEPYRGLELDADQHDWFAISPDRRTLTVRMLTSNVLDQIRVVTAKSSPADVALTQTAPWQPANPAASSIVPVGDTFDYTLAVANQGPGAASQVAIERGPKASTPQVKRSG